MDQLLSTHETAAQLGIASDTLRAWRTEGKGPEWIKINGWNVRYRQSAVTAWIDSLSAGQPKKTTRMY